MPDCVADHVLLRSGPWDHLVFYEIPNNALEDRKYACKLFLKSFNWIQRYPLICVYIGLIVVRMPKGTVSAVARRQLRWKIVNHTRHHYTSVGTLNLKPTRLVRPPFSLKRADTESKNPISYVEYRCVPWRYRACNLGLKKPCVIDSGFVNW